MIWLLLLPLLFLIPSLNQYLYLPGSSYTDLLVSHLPNALFLRQSLATWGTVPFWSDNILGGYPFIANPLSGIWYIPGWLGIVLPAPFGFNLAVWLHLLWGGLGMYFYLRSERISPPAAVIGGVLFEAMPKVIAHLAAGHVTYLYSISWTPWLLLTIKKSSYNRKFIVNLLPGVVYSFLLLADVRWGVFAGILWIFFSLLQSFTVQIPTQENEGTERKKEIGYRLQHWIVRILPSSVLATCLSAPFLLPFFEYVRLSTRSILSSSDNFTLSLPPARLIGFLYPSFGDSAEWTVYMGAIALVLFLFVLFSPRLRGAVKFWIGLVIFSVCLALGPAIPGVERIASLPGLNLLRVPARWIFMAGIGFAIITAQAVDHLLLDLPSERLTRKVQPSLIPAVLIIFIGMLTGGIWWLTGEIALNFIWGAVAIILASLILILRLNSKISSTTFLGFVFVLILLDITGVNWQSISPKATPIWERGQEDLANYLKSQKGYFRVYSPSYSLPQELAAFNNIQLVDGVDPMQLKRYRDYMVLATGIPNSTYSVTLPPYNTGSPEIDNRLAKPDSNTLGKLNVGFVTAEFPQEAHGLSLIGTFGNSYLYRNTDVYPRAWVASSEHQPASSVQTVRILDYQPNEIKLKGEGPGELILSEIAYPGWKVWIDGKSGNWHIVDGIFRGVTLSDGMHEVEYRYVPTYLNTGIGLGTFGILILLFAGVRWLRRVR